MFAPDQTNSATSRNVTTHTAFESACLSAIWSPPASSVLNCFGKILPNHSFLPRRRRDNLSEVVLGRADGRSQHFFSLRRSFFPYFPRTFSPSAASFPYNGRILAFGVHFCRNIDASPSSYNSDVDSVERRGPGHCGEEAAAARKRSPPRRSVLYFLFASPILPMCQKVRIVEKPFPKPRICLPL